MNRKTYTYKICSDGTEIQANVYSNPLSSKSSLRPIALLIHGGGWTIGSQTDIPESEIEVLLELGFIAVTVNYRLCPTINLFDGPITDTYDALNWCQMKLPGLLQHESSGETSVAADGSKVVAVGWSAGGHLALMLSQAPTPPLAILTLYPVTALSDPYWHIPAPQPVLSMIPTDLDPLIAPQVFTVSKTPPTSSPSVLDFSTPRIAWTFSSLATGIKTMACIGDGNIDRVDPRTWYVDPNPEASGMGKKFPPVMVMHGDQDELAPTRLSVEMVECIRRQGGTARIEMFSGKGHGFDMMIRGEERVALWPRVKQGFEFLCEFV